MREHEHKSGKQNGSTRTLSSWTLNIMKSREHERSRSKDEQGIDPHLLRMIDAEGRCGCQQRGNHSGAPSAQLFANAKENRHGGGAEDRRRQSEPQFAGAQENPEMHQAGINN